MIQTGHDDPVCHASSVDDSEDRGGMKMSLWMETWLGGFGMGLIVGGLAVLVAVAVDRKRGA